MHEHCGDSCEHGGVLYARVATWEPHDPYASMLDESEEERVIHVHRQQGRLF